MKRKGDDMYTKEDVLNSAKQQLDLHIHLLQNDLGVNKAEIEIELHGHMKKALKHDS